MAAKSPDPKQRFSSRVDAYVRYRPGYPNGIIAYLRERYELRERSAVADVGAGTGIFTELLLANGNTVYAVEPNDAMRGAAEARLAGNPRFISVAAPAEQTTLRDASVDMITAAQSFHWFEAAAARREFARILQPGGPVVLIWNARLTETTPFLADYERFLLEYATDYAKVNHVNVERTRLEEFYAPSTYTTRSFPNEQVLDLDGLRGRLGSSSYMPGSENPRYTAMLEALSELFARYEVGGRVRLEYSTNVYCGRLR